jgi:hypothetical protein
MGLWRHTVLTAQISTLSTILNGEIKNRDRSIVELEAKLASLQKENLETNARVSDALRAAASEAMVGAELAKKNRNVLETVYDIRESKSGAIVVSPRSPDGAITIGK